MNAQEIIDALEHSDLVAENEGQSTLHENGIGGYFEGDNSLDPNRAETCIYVGAQRFRLTVVKEA